MLVWREVNGEWVLRGQTCSGFVRPHGEVVVVELEARTPAGLPTHDLVMFCRTSKTLREAMAVARHLVVSAH